MKLETDELDLTAAESRTTYEEIKGYVEKEHEESLGFVHFSNQKKCD